MPSRLFLIFVIVLCCGLQTAQAQVAVDRQAMTLDTEFEHASGARSAHYLIDPEHALSLTEVRNHDEWQLMKHRFTSFGFTEDALWLKLTLKNLGPTKTFITRLEYPLLDQIQFYYPDAQGIYQRHLTGDQYAFDSRMLKDRFFSFPVEIQQGESKTLFWRVESQDTLIVPLTVATQDYWETGQLDAMLLFGMYYGAIVIILFINSFLYFFLRQKAQIYYVALLANYAVVELSLNGTGNVYLWQDYPEFTKVIRPFALGMLSILTVKLTKSYFGLRTIRLAGINLEPAVLTVGVLAMLVAVILPFPWAIKASLIAMMIVTPYVLATAFHQLYLQKTAAKYYIIGWVGFLLGGLLNILRAFDLIEVSFLSTYGSQIGSLFTLVILNMGLTDQFREVQRLSERNKERIIRRQELLNQELDSAVKDRTQELEAQKQDADRARLIAEQALATKSQFLATMSHEIRTPMNGVLGITQMLMDTPLDNHQRHLITTIKHSGDTLVSIINDILDYSKIEAGKLTVEHIELDLRNLLDECIELFSTAITNKHIRLLLNVSVDTPTIIAGDPTRLRQIIINLLGNAIKFTDQGYVALCTQYDSTRSELRVSVQDTGIGISDEQQRKLFQSFSQADSSTTRKFGGTGLGLAISKSLTQLMGGQISVKSRPSSGSEFWLDIPCRALTFPQPDPVLQGKRILVLDALPEAVTSVKNILESVGAIVLQATETLRSDAPLTETVDLIIQHTNYSGVQPHPDHQCPTLTLQPLGEKPSGPDLSIHDPFTQTQLVQTLYRKFTGHNETITGHNQSDDFSTLNVLVAEDNKVNQMVVKGLLKKFNIDPDLANDGLEAIRQVTYSSTPYDLILMDCEMPNLDGYQATRQLRELSQCTATRIVGLSAHAMQEHRDAGLAAGMANFLTKPIAVETLAAELSLSYQHKTGELPK